MKTIGWARWWPVTGIGVVALWIVGLVFLSGVDTHDDDSVIVAHYAKHSNRVHDIVGFFLILAAVLVFVWFLGSLRKRLALAEGGQPLLTAIAFGAGLVTSGLWLVANALFVAPSFAVSDTSKFVLDPNTYRLLSDLGYTVWFSGTTIAAALVFATAVLSIRTGLLPKWLAWLSILVGITMLVSFFFLPFLIMLGWMLVVSITLIARPAAAPAPAQPV
jgi:hypothetical protein